VFSRFGRAHVAYSRVDIWAVAGVLAIGVASIVVAYAAV